MSDCMRKTSIASINLKYKESNDENNDENMYAYESPYTSYRIYNCKRGAYISNNFICIDVISIISKSEKEDDNISVNVKESYYYKYK